MGDYAASLHDADEVLQLTETHDEYQMFYAEALRVKGLALYRLGQSRHAVEFLEASLNLYTRLNDTSSIPILFMETGIVYGAIGNYAEAGASYEKALLIWRQEGNLSWQANLLNNLGVLRHSQGEYEKAALAFEEGLVCAQRSGYTRLEASIAIGLGDLYTELEDFSVAQRNYQHAEEVVQQMDDRFILFYLKMAQVSLALLQKNVMEARKLVTSVALMVQAGDSLYEKGLLDLALGRLSLLQGNPSQAVGELEEAERCFSEDGLKVEGDANRIWLVAAYHQTKNHPAARQMIKGILGGRGQVAHGYL